MRRSWLPRPTVRLRIAALFATMFFVTGALLLSVSYALVDQNLTRAPVTLDAAARERFGLPPAPRFRTPAELAERRLKEVVHQQLADDALSRLRIQYGLALVALTGLALLLGWAMATRALRPIGRIASTARRVSTDNLDERIELRGPDDELKDLADTFDAMLERLARAFASQRRFVANASHELRTPLTLMRTEIDVALADEGSSPEQLREMAEVVRDAIDRTERLIESLLTLARSESAIDRTEPVDLAQVAAFALEVAEPELGPSGLRVEERLRSAPTVGDRRLLERLAANLVENAVRHNAEDGWLAVETGESEGSAFIRVTNSGCSIPAADAEAMAEPFERLGRAARDQRGAGLGLSIVRSVAAAHGGELNLQPRPEGGLEATVAMPPEARPPSGRAGGRRPAVTAP